MDRYLPLVKALNAILSLNDEDEVMFIVNDPMFVESNHLPAYVRKRNPDIVSVTLEFCKKWLDVKEPGTFQQCKLTVAEEEEEVEGNVEAEVEVEGESKVEVEGKAKAKAKVTGRGRGKGKGKGKGKEKGKGKQVKQQEKRGWAPIWQFWELKKL